MQTMSFQLLIGSCALVYLTLSVGNTQAGGIYECENNDGCIADNTQCVDNLCTCPPGHILNNDGDTCLKLASGLTDPCEIYEQCATIAGHAECRDNACVCAKDSVYLRKACIKRLKNDSKCKKTEDCFDGSDYNSRVCSESVCKCAPGYYDRDGVDCRRIANVGDACIIDLDCTNSKCVDTVCTSESSTQRFEESELEINIENNLDLDYIIEEDETMEPQLGEECTTNDDCNVNDVHAICSSIFKACTCKKGFFIKSKKCVPELTMPCKINEETGKSDCASGTVCEQGVCTCAVLKVYDALNQKCKKPVLLPLLECSTDNSCKLLVNNYYCDYSSKVCKCEKGYTINDHHVCIGSCSTDADCDSKLENSICNEDSECVCPSEYVQINNECEPRVGGKCKQDADCHSTEDNTHCSEEGFCTCNDRFVPNDYSCLPVANIGDHCEISEQCQWKSDASCSGNKCVCDDGYLNVDGNCLRLATKVGDYCTHPAVCMKNTICLKSKCTCERGLKPTGDLTGCYNPDGDNEKGLPTFNFNMFVVSISSSSSYD